MKNIKRTLRINYIDESFENKEIDKATEVNLTDSTTSFMYIELTKTGKYRLTWTKNFLEHDISQLKNIEMIREN